MRIMARRDVQFEGKNSPRPFKEDTSRPISTYSVVDRRDRCVKKGSLGDQVTQVTQSPRAAEKEGRKVKSTSGGRWNGIIFREDLEPNGEMH
jgi:hypothetical protein